MGDAGSIYHIAPPADAERLRRSGSLEPGSLAAEGFVHCSTADQVVATTDRYFAGETDLVLVELDPDLIGHEISWPEVYPGQRYPHVHGPLPAAAVVAVLPWSEADRRRWRPEPRGAGQR
jgi:uncharacterized protein (DUF952 family)